jgi:hypothetical protein
MAVKKVTGYKRRIGNEPSRDSYASFREGKQVSSETIDGRRITHRFRAMSS